MRTNELFNTGGPGVPSDKGLPDGRDAIVVAYSDANEGWVAFPAHLPVMVEPGVSGVGDSPSQAIEQLLLAMIVHAEAGHE